LLTLALWKWGRGPGEGSFFADTIREEGGRTNEGKAGTLPEIGKNGRAGSREEQHSLIEGGKRGVD